MLQNLKGGHTQRLMFSKKPAGVANEYLDDRHMKAMKRLENLRMENTVKEVCELTLRPKILRKS
jgi:hypothetical protein